MVIIANWSTVSSCLWVNMSCIKRIRTFHTALNLLKIKPVSISVHTGYHESALIRMYVERSEGCEFTLTVGSCLVAVDPINTFCLQTGYVMVE